MSSISTSSAASAARTAAGTSSAGVPQDVVAATWGPKRAASTSMVAGPELVALGVDARTHHAGDARGAQRPHGDDGLVQHAGGEAPPTGMGRAHHALAGHERDGSAVPDPDADGAAGLGRDERVAGAPGEGGVTVHDHHGGAVHLLQPRHWTAGHGAPTRRDDIGRHDIGVEVAVGAGGEANLGRPA